MKTVLGTFASRDAAERAVQQLRQQGFEKEISIVTKDEMKGEKRTAGYDPVMDGTTTGGVVGGLLGLAVGAGALAIPGLGPIIAAGPIAGLLSGAAAGGLAGGLIDWGIPAERGRFYEEQVKQGQILVAVRTDDTRVNQAANILRQFGAANVESH